MPDQQQVLTQDDSDTTNKAEVARGFGCFLKSHLDADSYHIIKGTYRIHDGQWRIINSEEREQASLKHPL